MNELIKVTEKNGEQFKYCSFFYCNKYKIMIQYSYKISKGVLNGFN